MSKQPRAYHRPTDLAEALRLLAEPDTVPLGGGTKLLAGDIQSAVVDLQALGLDVMAHEGDHLRAGATARLADLADFLASAGPDSPAPLLRLALHRAGPNTYRHAATIGGSVAARLPDSELLAALLVLEAQLLLADGAATSLPAYWDADAPELIVACRIPWGAGEGALERVARTPADYPIVSVAGWRPSRGEQRLAATGIAPWPIRLEGAEAALRAGSPGDAAMAAARAVCRHPGDFRGSADYRREMVGVLLRRALANPVPAS